MRGEMISGSTLVRIFTLFLLVLLPAGALSCSSGKPVQESGKEPLIEDPDLNRPLDLPEFIFTVRAYGGGGYDDFQFNSQKELGLEYIHHGFEWGGIEPRDDGWKWDATDSVMDKIAEHGLKIILSFIIPKGSTAEFGVLDWISRDDPNLPAEYGEFCYEVINRYRDHPAWSGLATVWGGSSDVVSEAWFHSPEHQVALLNAAYDGIKRADPAAVVISFNIATSCTDIDLWREWHEAAFNLSPRFDWFGLTTHAVPPTYLESPGAYAGVAGLTNVRQFLDEHGYADKPIFVSEGGYTGLTDEIQAGAIIQTCIITRALDLDIRGWIYYYYFAKSISPEDPDAFDSGLLHPALDHPSSLEPKAAWFALRNLINNIGFFEYEFEKQLSGEFNEQSMPFVYLFKHRERTQSRLWAIFSPRLKETTSHEVTINIAPDRTAVLIDMAGSVSEVAADQAGNVTLTASEEPSFLKTGD